MSEPEPAAIYIDPAEVTVVKTADSGEIVAYIWSPRSRAIVAPILADLRAIAGGCGE